MNDFPPNFLQGKPDDVLKALKDLPAEKACQSVKELVLLIRDPAQAEKIREQAALTLGTCRSDQSRHELRSLLDDEDSLTRQFAVGGLGEDDNAETILWLIDALTDDVNKVRNVSERSLLKRDAQLASIGVQPLLLLIEHPQRLTRAPACRLLGLTKSERALQPLLDQLNSKEWLDRMWAIKGLGDLGNSQAVEPVKNCLFNDEKNRVRAAAVEAIKSLKPDQIEEILERVQDRDDDEGVQKAVTDAIASLGFESDDTEFDPFADD